MQSSVTVYKLKPDRRNHRPPSMLVEGAMRQRSGSPMMEPDWHFIDTIHELGGEIIRQGQFLRATYYTRINRDSALAQQRSRAYAKRKRWKIYFEKMYGKESVWVKPWKSQYRF